MGTVPSPIVSEFETVEQEASYNEWLKAKVAASLADTRPAVPHDEVMAEIDALTDQLSTGKEHR
ncbi:antitoxin [Salmonella enterica]|nr:antitoxin [Salmonella enterica]